MSHSILRIERIKSFSDTTGIQKHVQRETKNYTNQDIEKERTHLNFDFINSENVDFNEKVKERIEEGYTGKRKVRSDAIRLVDGIITSDRAFFDNMSDLDTEYFFEDTLEFLKEEFGEKNLVYATVHLDEKTPHMHFGFVPITEDGRLSAKEMIGNKKQMSALQDKFNEFVNEKGYEMQRGEASIVSEREHQRVETFKKETDYHKKELDNVKSDLNRQFDLLASMNSKIPESDDLKAKKKEFKLPEVKKYNLNWFNIVKEEELAKLYETIDEVVEYTDKQQVALENQDQRITELKVVNYDLTNSLRKQQSIEAERMTELNDTWETKYNELKAQHDHLTHITEAKINKKAENFMENKIVDTENENSRLKSRVNELESELTQVNDENNTLHSTISDMEDDYNEMEESYQKEISSLKERFENVKRDLTQQIVSMYEATKYFIKEIKGVEFKDMFNAFRLRQDKALHEKSNSKEPVNMVERIVERDNDEAVVELDLDLDEVRKEVNFNNRKAKERDDGMEM